MITRLTVGGVHRWFAGVLNSMPGAAHGYIIKCNNRKLVTTGNLAFYGGLQGVGNIQRVFTRSSVYG